MSVSNQYSSCQIIPVNEQLIITTMICGEGNYARNVLCVQYCG